MLLLLLHLASSICAYIMQRSSPKIKRLFGADTRDGALLFVVVVSKEKQKMQDRCNIVWSRCGYKDFYRFRSRDVCIFKNG